MKRLIANIIAVLALLGFVTVCVLWWRSRTVVDEATWTYDRWLEDGSAASNQVHLNSKKWLWLTVSWGRVGPPNGQLVWGYYVNADNSGGKPRFTYRSEPYAPMLSELFIDFDTGTTGWGPVRWLIASRSRPKDGDDYGAVQVGVSHWLLALILLVPPALRLNGIRKTRRLRKLGQCPACGYDLRATPGRCPECGREPDGLSRIMQVRTGDSPGLVMSGPPSQPGRGGETSGGADPMRTYSKAIALLLALSTLPARRALFCNNEDFSNPKTRMWFVPGDAERHGCALLGFDDDWGQGGVNTKGLAFDWVAGFKEKWEPDPKKATPKGNSAQRMLETCATVDQAIAFYEKHNEPGFGYGRMLVADASGASAVIGFKDGRLDPQKMNRSRGLGMGFGMRGDFATKRVAQEPEPTIANATDILKACRQEGKNATKYSNVFDLKSGEILLFQFPVREDATKLNLAEELKKGGHYYDIPDIREQLTKELKPLTDEMKKG
jgi:hypothetical protein